MSVQRAFSGLSKVRFFALLFGAACVFLPSATEAQQATLYATTTSILGGGEATAQVVTINPTTGVQTTVATIIGPTKADFSVSFGAALDSVGNQYFTGGCIGSGCTSWTLYSVNLMTGSVSSVPLAAGSLNNLQFDGTSGTLYATTTSILGGGEATAQVVTINPTTGVQTTVATIIGPTKADFSVSFGAALDSVGNQYFTGGCIGSGCTSWTLYSVNLMTGSVSSVPLAAGSLNNLQFDGTSGTLYATTTSILGGGEATAQVVTINPTTGVQTTVATIIGPTKADFSVSFGAALDSVGNQYFTGGCIGSGCTSWTLYSVNLKTGSVSSVPLAAGSLNNLVFQGANPNAAPAFTITGGNGQTGQPATILPQPLTVNVNPSSPSVPITFTISQTPSGSTGTSLSTTAPVTTDVNGNAAVSLTLGNMGGQYQVTASCSSCNPTSVTFTETATAGRTLTYVSGVQTGTVSQAGTQPLVVNVASGGVAVGNVPVVFTLISTPSSAAQGGGFAASGSASMTITVNTASNGTASTAFEFGDLVGNYTVTASCAGCSSNGGPFTLTAGCNTASWSQLNPYYQGDNSLFPDAVPAMFGYTPPVNPPVPNPVSSGFPFVQCTTVNSGCALTSTAAMLSTTSSGLFVDTPLRLDQALSSLSPKPGYGQGCQGGGNYPNCPQKPIWCLLAWDQISQVAPGLTLISSGGIGKILEELLEPKNGGNPAFNSVLDSYLQKHVCVNGDRVILDLQETKTTSTFTSTSHHFVFVSGQTSSSNGINVDWNVWDPGWRFASPAANTMTLSGHNQGFTTGSGSVNHTFAVYGARTFRENQPTSALGITANSPVELLLTDSQGRQVGNMPGSGNDVFGIPLASYFRDFPLEDDTDDVIGISDGDGSGIKTLYIPGALASPYQLQLTGTAAGRFTLTFLAGASDGSVQTTTLQGITNTGSTTTYQLQYNSVPGSVLQPSLVATSSGTVPSTQIAATASGLAYSRVTQTFNGTVTINNIGTTTINGPIQIVFTSLTSGVTVANNTNTFGGMAYSTVPNVATLSPGQSITVAVQFKNPSNTTITFTPAIYSGNLN